MRWMLVTLAAVVLAAACSSDNPTSTATTTTTTTTTRPGEPYALGRRLVELVDDERPTMADPTRNLPSEPDRTLETLLLYPARGAGDAEATPVDGAAPSEGSFPLVVFAHGLSGNGPVMEEFLVDLARAGYVVAAPTFPRTSGPGAPWDDWANQPADVSFVIDALLGLPDDDPLATHIDPEAIGVAGHSLGAMTTIGLTLNICCLDERIDAALPISGRRLPYPGAWDLDATPFLLVHGASDTIVPIAGSDTIFAEAPGPAAYLRLPDASHGGFLHSEEVLIDAAMVGFFDRYLYGDEDALDELTDLVDAHATATFEMKPSP